MIILTSCMQRVTELNAKDIPTFPLCHRVIRDSETFYLFRFLKGPPSKRRDCLSRNSVEESARTVSCRSLSIASDEPRQARPARVVWRFVKFANGRAKHASRIHFISLALATE